MSLPAGSRRLDRSELAHSRLSSVGVNAIVDTNLVELPVFEWPTIQPECYVGHQRDGCMISAVFEPKRRFRLT